jgi:STE24 endopeptidase
MTATRMAGRGATLAAAVGLWLLAASILWRTSVPHDLRLPHVDADRLFTAAQIHRAQHFSGLLTWLAWGAALAELTVLALVAWFAKRIANAFEVGRIGRGILVGCVAGTLVWAVALPFDLTATWWQDRYGIVFANYWVWATGAWASLGFDIAFSTLIIVLLMALAAALPRTWWIPAAGILTAYVAVLAAVSPYVMFDTHPVRDPALQASIRRLERIEGVTGTPVDIERVSDQTRAVNAETIGYGPTSHVVLWDTLVDRYSPRQVVVVVAHELGHVRSRHILKSIGWMVLVLLPELFLVALLTRRRGGMAQPAAVPVALLVLSVLAVVTAPGANDVSRRYEAEADWRALNATRDPQAATGLFRRFATDDLEEPNPSTLDYLFFENHPTLLQRIGMVRAWRARNGG